MGAFNLQAARRRGVLPVVGAWVFAAASLVLAAWLTAGSYARQALTTLPGGSSVIYSACRDAACSPDPADLIEQQLTTLRNTRSLVYGSAWSLTVLGTIILAVATVLILRDDRRAARFLDVAWKVQAAWAVLLTALLVSGFTATPQAVAAPLTGDARLYYLCWFVSIATAGTALTRALRSRASEEASR